MASAPVPGVDVPIGYGPSASSQITLLTGSNFQDFDLTLHAFANVAELTTLLDDPTAFQRSLDQARLQSSNLASRLSEALKTRQQSADLPALTETSAAADRAFAVLNKRPGQLAMTLLSRVSTSIRKHLTDRAKKNGTRNTCF